MVGAIILRHLLSVKILTIYFNFIILEQIQFHNDSKLTYFLYMMGRAT
ncbi:hypothetical protein ANACOL_04163 [Anaerotruncus colihominis DSM 17241]|uniref:Uncharacterized protein n=1 Tax=Anaerotruncus colihominis DSM 17241 TaxID=445972 RepID=B0PGL1_9FIRM|nr:hypothetical protein ANACOL_04163 [Anaerotruncus colihominis DSM 17241]